MSRQFSRSSSTSPVRSGLRFPSLTFVEGAGGEQTGPTSIKNANLKSELIVDDQSKQKTSDLFDNVPEAENTIESQAEITAHDTDVSTANTIVGTPVLSPTNQINSQQVPPLAYEESFHQEPSHLLSGGPVIAASSHLHHQQRHSTERGSIYSAMADDANSIYQSSQYQQPLAKKVRKTSDGESFIYHDGGSVRNTTQPDIASTRRGRRPSKLTESEIDNQSLITTERLSPVRRKFIEEPYVISPSQASYTFAPSTPSQAGYRPHMVSKVRQVSQRIFSNNNMGQHSIAEESTASTTLCHSQSKHHLLLPLSEFDLEEDTEANDEDNDDESLVSRPFHKQYTYSSGDQTPTYGTFKNDGPRDEMDPRYYYNSPHDYKGAYSRQNGLFKIAANFIIFLVLCLLSLVLLRLIVLKNFDNSVDDFKVTSLDNILVTEELLFFEVTAEGRNTNLQDISIWNMNLDVFMQTDSGHLNKADKGNDLAILLGNSTSFVTPLKFNGILNSPESANSTFSWKPSSLWHRLNHKHESVLQNVSGQIKIKHPGASFRYKGKPLMSEQWSKLFNAKFKLIVRGSFSYHLPLIRNDQILSVSSEMDAKPGL